MCGECNWETSKLQSEFGSSSEVRWLTEKDVTGYDSDGNILLCEKCSKKASASIVSSTVSLNLCSKCFMELLNERKTRDT